MSEFDNYIDIENGGTKKNDLTLSNIYSVREGGFGKERGLKTYLSTLTVEELRQDIQFYETLSREKDWPVSHIIQREVDDDRVNAIVKKYILGEGRDVKYFPPIIIALLPRDSDGNFSADYNFTPDVSDQTKNLIIDKSKYRSNDAFIKMFTDKKNLSTVDGLYFFPTITVFDHCLLCWDPSKFYAIVIDGQHRLDALIRSKDTDATYANALQDVVFIDVSQALQNKKETTPIEIFRTIFIDINTNAKSVGLVRRILIDDKDLGSLCVQSLVESITRAGASKDVNQYIPSVLIDWDGGSLKHEIPYITGVLTLHQIINDELVSDRLVSVNDHRDQKKIQYFINLLNDVFFVDNTIKANAEHADISTLENSFKAYLKEKEATREIFAEELQDEALDSILFNYDYRVLDIAQGNFERYFLEPIVSVFTKLNHYVSATTMLMDLGAFDNNSLLYKALLISKRKLAANENMKNVYFEARQKMNEALNVNYYLLFTVVGQKAIFKCIFERVWNNFKHGVTPETITKVFDEFINQFNSAMAIFDKNKFYIFGKDEFTIETESTLFSEYDKIYYSFWEGILYEDKRIIYNSQGVRALADIINLILRCIEEPSNIQMRNIDEYNIRFAEQRTRRLLRKRFARTEEEYESVAGLMIKNKKQYLLDRINAMLIQSDRDA